MRVPPNWPDEISNALVGKFQLSDREAVRTFVETARKQCGRAGRPAPVVTQRPIGQGRIEVRVVALPPAARKLADAAWLPVRRTSSDVLERERETRRYARERREQRAAM